MGYHPVAVVIMHVHKYEVKIPRNLSQEGYMRSMQ